MLASTDIRVNRRSFCFLGSRVDSGMTLIELLVAVAIAAILMAIAVPSFVGFLADNKVQSQARTLSNGLAFARSEAVSRSISVTICGLNTATNRCKRRNDTDDWADGWLVFADDRNGVANGQRNATGEEILKIEAVSSNNIVTLKNADGDNISVVTFDSRGSMQGVADSGAGLSDPERLSMEVCPEDKEVRRARALSLELTGRALPTRDSNDDGTFGSAFGVNLQCP